MRGIHAVLLHGIMRLPASVADVTRTSDGHYLAREHGDIGFNLFLGKPNPRRLPETVRLSWESFRTARDAGIARDVVRLARASKVCLRDFLPRSR